MGSVYKKLVRREFGEENYARYCRYLLYETGRNSPQNPMIYEDMYHFLEGKDKQVLLFMRGRLEQVLIKAFFISKGYTAKLSAALGVMFFVLLTDLYNRSIILFAKKIQVGDGRRVPSLLSNLMISSSPYRRSAD